MVQSKLDSFYVKFKTLLRGEKDATLTLKSEAGRAVISLSVDLGHVLSEPGLLHHRPRNGPSRQRRRERRTAAREQQVAAEEAELDAVKALGEPSEAVKSTEKVEKKDAESNTCPEVFVNTGKVPDSVETTEKETDVTAEEATVLVKEPKDEVCPDENYAEKGNEKPNPSPTTTPARFRGLGGVDYYSITYDDPSYSDDSE